MLLQKIFLIIVRLVGNPARVISTTEKVEEKYKRYAETVKDYDFSKEEDIDRFFWQNKE